MPEDYSTQLWHEICYLLSESISSAINENIFEQKVIMVFEKLGWSQYNKEIQIQTSLPIGRQGTIRPDIILFGPDKKPLIAIEVKKPSENLLNIDQLKSYMRQVKADFGLLIGGEILVYYDGSHNPYPEPVQLDRISFNPSLNRGNNFVEIFTKINFLEQKYLNFLDNKIAKINREMEIDKLKQEICSDRTKDKIFSFLKTELQDISKDILSEVFKNLEINIKYTVAIAAPPTIHKISKPVIEHGYEYIQICKNRSSGKIFIFFTYPDTGMDCLVNQEGKIIEFNNSLFFEPEDMDRKRLIQKSLVTDLQVKKYDSMIKMAQKKTFKLPANPGSNKPQSGNKTPSPPAFNWANKISQLSGYSFGTWVQICDHLNLEVRGDSARRVLSKWVKINKPDWPNVPELDSDSYS